MKYLINFSKFYFLILLLGHYLPAFGLNEGAQTVTLDGVLYKKSSTTAIVDSSVNLKVQILNPSGTCILYEESQLVNTSTTKGYFSIQVGSALGSLKRTVSDPGRTMGQVFQNSMPIIANDVSTGSCLGGNYLPTAGDVRYFRITVTPSTTNIADTLTPDIVMDSVPQAIVAQSLQGLERAHILAANTSGTISLTQANLESAFTGSAWTNLQSILNGNFLRTDTSGATLPSYASTPAGVSTGDMWYDSVTNEIKYQTNAGTQTVGATGAVSGNSITSGTISGSTAWNTTGAITTTGAVTGSTIIASTVSGSIVQGTTLSGSTVQATNLRIYNGSQYAQFTAQPMSANYSLALPTADGVSGQVMATNGSGILSWITPSTGAAGTISVGQGGTAATAFSSSRIIASNVTGTALASFSCSLNQVISFDVTGAAQCSSLASIAGSALIANGGNSTGAAISIGTNDNVALQFKTNNSVAITISENGNVGIGTSSPAAALDVSGIIRSNGTYTGLGNSMNIGFGNSVSGDNFGIGTSNSVTGRYVYMFGNSNTNGNGFWNYVVGEGNSIPNGIDRAYIFGRGITNSIGDSVMIGTSDSRKLTILNSGNVGIGTSNPGAAVTVKRSGTELPQIRLEDADITIPDYSSAGFNPALSANTTGGMNTIGAAIGGLKLDGFSSTSDSRAMAFMGYSGANTVSMPVITFGAWKHNGATSRTAIASSDIGFDFNSGSNNLIRIMGDGKMGIGVSTPSSALDLNGALTAQGVSSAPGVSGSNQGRIYFDYALNKFRISENGGAYTDLVSSAGAGDILNGGNTTGAAVVVGTNDNFPLRLEANNSVALTISQGGHVGIGTTSPQRLLHMSGASSVTQLFENTTAGADLKKRFVGIGTSGEMFFGKFSDDLSSTTYQMNIDTNGNVGIGTQAPGQLLEIQKNHDAPTTFRVSNSNTGSNARVRLELSDGSSAKALLSYIPSSGAFYVANGQNAPLHLQTNALDRMYISANGSVGIGNINPQSTLDILSTQSSGSVRPYRNGLNVRAEGSSPGGRLQSMVASTSEFPTFMMARSRGTLAAPAALQSGDVLGGLAAYGYNGTDWGASNNSGILFTASENWSSSAMGSEISFLTLPNGSNNALERMRISNLGNVGIGTSTPTSLLHTRGTSGITAEASNNSAGTSFFSGTYAGTTQLSARFGGAGEVQVQVSDTVDNDNGSFFVAKSGESFSRSVLGRSFVGFGPGNITRDTFLSRPAANTLRVSSDNSTGAANLIVNGKVGVGSSATPTASLEVTGHVAFKGTSAALGTCGSGSSLSGNDTRGFVNVGTGSATTSCTLNFASAFSTAPICTVSWRGSVSNINMGVTSTTTALTIDFSADAQGLSFNYICFE